MFIRVTDDLWVDSSDVKRVEIYSEGSRKWVVWLVQEDRYRKGGPTRVFKTQEEARAWAAEIVKQLNGVYRIDGVYSEPDENQWGMRNDG